MADDEREQALERVTAAIEPRWFDLGAAVAATAWVVLAVLGAWQAATGSQLTDGAFDRVRTTLLAAVSYGTSWAVALAALVGGAIVAERSHDGAVAPARVDRTTRLASVAIVLAVVTFLVGAWVGWSRYGGVAGTGTMSITGSGFGGTGFVERARLTLITALPNTGWYALAAAIAAAATLVAPAAD